ncbi:MAG: hypothetical protein ACI87E_002025 [Mariniblastus sp.]|jgi:hypothetical protein
MRFDKTFIAIRERSVLEIFDLSLHVFVDHFRSLFWLLVIGATPWIALDLWLTHWMLDADEFGQLYYWVMFLLVVSQAQVGTLFMTSYLGRAMFVGRPGIWATIKDSLKTSPYFIWSHGIIRTAILALLSTFWISESDWGASLLICWFVLPGWVSLGILIRAFRPFVSEILLLERTPISKKDENQIFFSRRSKALHVSATSELFGRFSLSVVLAIPLTFTCFSTLVWIDTVMNIRANAEYSFSPYYWIASMWLVAGFICVSRFLSYIDTRIRQEGWSVELRMRAEGQLLVDALD